MANIIKRDLKRESKQNMWRCILTQGVLRAVDFFLIKKYTCEEFRHS